MRRVSERHASSQRRAVWPPEPGSLFRYPLVRGGWGVPCQLVLSDNGTWHAVVDGRPREPHRDPELAQFVADIWHYGVRVSQQTYDWLTKEREYRRRFGPPNHPAINPTMPMHPAQLPPLPLPSHNEDNP